MTDWVKGTITAKQDLSLGVPVCSEIWVIAQSKETVVDPDDNSPAPVWSRHINPTGTWGSCKYMLPVPAKQPFHIFMGVEGCRAKVKHKGGWITLDIDQSKEVDSEIISADCVH